MKKLIPIFLFLIIPCAEASAQGDLQVPEEVIALVDGAVSLVRDNLPRRVQTPVVIGVEGLQMGGGNTQFGELFALIMTTRLANDGDDRIRVLAGHHREALERSDLFQPGTLFAAGGAMPDYVVNGKLYLVEGTLLAAVQLIQMPDLVVAGGFELSFHLTDAVRGLIRPSSFAGEEGWDPFEPDSVDRPRVLAPGQSSSEHTLTPAGDEDWFIIELVDLGGSGFMSVYTMGSTDTYIEVYGPDDHYSLLTENDDSEDQNARVYFAVEAGQRFWIKVRGYDESSTGPYAIASEIEEYGDDPLEPNDRMEDAALLPSDGQWLASVLIPTGDADWFYVDVPDPVEGSGLFVVETGGEMDTYLDLFSADGDDLASDDDGGSDANARIDLVVEEAVRYYVRVRHYDDSGTGPYRIRAAVESVTLDPFEPDNTWGNATRIGVDGQEQRHSFVPGQDIDWIKFSVTSPATVKIETGGNTDTVMLLIDSEENLIAEDDDGGEEGNARIERFLQQGLYYIRITQFDDNPVSGAEYTISVTVR